MENKKAALAALVRKWCEEKDNAVRMESRMKTVIAIDSFKGSMTSMEAGNAAAAGVKAVFPDAEIVVRPLADGGEGTVEALTTGMGGRMETALVSDPLGRKISASYGILEKNKTAVIEMAAAAGLPLLSKEERNPLHTTTYGVGELIRDAIRKGCRHFIVGIGGSATNDGGVGMLSALGFEFLDKSGQPVRNGAAGLADLAEIRSGHVLPVLKECTFRVACDVENSLCGELGCSSVFGPQKGADEKSIRQMDQWLFSYAQLTKEHFLQADENCPGAGAAGGLGFAFRAFLRGKLEPGINIVLEEIGIETAIKDADIVITGEGCLDGQTVMGKAPIGIARLAKKYGKPVIAFSGAVTEDAAACNQAGIDAFFPILRQVTTLEAAMSPATAIRNMTAAVEQTFRLLKMSFIYGKEFKMYSVSPLDFSHKQE